MLVERLDGGLVVGWWYGGWVVAWQLDVGLVAVRWYGVCVCWPGGWMVGVNVGKAVGHW